MNMTDLSKIINYSSVSLRNSPMFKDLVKDTVEKTARQRQVNKVTR